ncbi:MAG: glycosyltransferase family protein [Weeksellaceae bacterium]|nr:glycosyltransferase family protein [Bacteroidota bacterium]MCG2779521.1 glycosyltransferase family protein [Weeksellaceae bacterium]
MLSIIISTYKPHNFTALEKNITETAGIPFEIIKIENPGTMGICEAYNSGAEKAKFENLLFLHDDVEFKTKNWVTILIKHLKDPETGALGVAGSNYIPSAPSGWFIEKGQKEMKENKSPAIALDGVFLSCTKAKFDNVRFNEEQIKGFHGYDCDFSLRMAKFYQNYIVHDIKIEHFSGGNPDRLFLDNNIKIRLNLGSNFNHLSNSQTETIAFRSFLRFYFKYYPVTVRNLCFTLRFFPFSKTRFNDQFQILTTYLQVIKYRKHQRSL